MTRYDSYKDSGIIWVGQTPQHWSEQKIKFLFKEKKSTPNLSLNCGSISFGRVVFKDDDSIPSSRKETYQEVLDGEFLINPLNLNYDLKSLRIARSDKNVVVSPGYMVLQLQRQSDPKFFEFLLHVFDTEHMKSLGSGVRQTISFSHLKAERLPLPPIDEQRKIGQYLDKKTTLIDSLIQKTGRKVELLKEKRTSLINQVVTKGLNPDVEMKDSGIEWIGGIPSHWGVTKYKYHFRIKGGFPFDSELITKDPTEFPIIRIGNVTSGEIDVYYLGELSEKIPVVEKGDYVISLTGDFNIRRWERKTALLNQRCGLVVPLGGLDRRYLFYLLPQSFSVLEETKYFTTLKNLSNSEVEDIEMCCPSLQEQEQIVEYLDEQTSIIDSTIATEEDRIELLKEYRQSLISEAVTGKIKVS